MQSVVSLMYLFVFIKSKGLERQWIKHQTSGDLDDSKVHILLV